MSRARRIKRVAVIALGGNALAPGGERSNIYDQFRHTRESLGPIVDLALDGWNVCVVHGNGPQVGDELVRNELARYDAPPMPLGVLVAATAGWIGCRSCGARTPCIWTGVSSVIARRNDSYARASTCSVWNTKRRPISSPWVRNWSNNIASKS